MSRTMIDSTDRDSTRKRLLEAAGEVFADHGFHAATIQLICQKAGANIAAVNYYFGSKENLYYETIKFGRSKTASLDSALPPELSTDDPEKALRQFIRAYLDALLSTERPKWLLRIMAREFIEPTPALDRFIEDVIQPWMGRLTQIVATFSPAKLPERQLNLIAQSVVGQCHFFFKCQAVILRLRGKDVKDGYDSSDIDEFEKHVTAFSIGGIRSLIGQTTADKIHRSN
ncbi:MAG TPA: CerR family C-terminal domain-containing protein [Phycisphaerae bacterium]|nr:CerR family C-terminal domain-containing protein [Phycisphaerae bacterium]